MESILTSIKKLLGISDEYDHYDPDIIVHINSVFMILTQLGIGPKNGFNITDESEKWEDFLSDEQMIHSVKSFIHLKVKLIFDPPLSSAVLESYKELIKELEWRLQVAGETTDTNSEEEIQNGE